MKGDLEFVIRINPVPASRPRVSKWGVYYSKTYRFFREEAPEAIAEAIIESGVGSSTLPLTGYLECEFVFNVKRPKKTKLKYPHADVDNLLKGAQDSMEGLIFENDKQIIVVKGRKQWSDIPSIKVTIRTLSS